jgi:hypothetical protein
VSEFANLGTAHNLEGLGTLRKIPQWTAHIRLRTTPYSNTGDKIFLLILSPVQQQITLLEDLVIGA